MFCVDCMVFLGDYLVLLFGIVVSFLCWVVCDKLEYESV